MKKQFRKAMLSTMAMLLVGVMSLTGVTYAWFSQGDTATVSQMTINVESAAGAITVATPDKDGKLEFTGTVTPTLGDAYNNAELVPVSAAVPANGSAPTFYTATLNSSSSITSKLQSDKTATVEKEKKAYWYEYDLYFANTGNKALDVYLKDESTVYAANGDSSSAAGAALATRISFTSYVTDNYADLIDSTSGNYLSSKYEGAMGTTIFFEPNAITHTSNGNSNYTSAKAVLGSFYNATVGDGNVYNYKAVNGVYTMNPFTGAEIGEEATGNGLTENAVTTSKIGDDTVITNIPVGGVAKVTVRIWLEGQDADCQNDVSAGTILANLKFTSKANNAQGD